MTASTNYRLTEPPAYEDFGSDFEDVAVPSHSAGDISPIESPPSEAPESSNNHYLGPQKAAEPYTSTQKSAEKPKEKMDYGGSLKRGFSNAANALGDFVSSTWTVSSNTKPPTFRKDDILIAVMGMTGAGKTSFINDVTGVDLTVGHSLESCTKDIQIATTRIGRHIVHFIDTPGYDDTELTDSDILTTIATYLRDDIRLSGLFYLHRITEPRVGGTAVKNIRLFRNLVGTTNMSNVVLLTTFWRKVSPRSEGEARQEELAAKFWKGMLAAGATLDMYGDTPADAHRIVGGMLRKAPVVLQLQAELQAGVRLEDTAAGREVSERLEKLQATHASEIAGMREEIMLASQARQEELAEELRSHYEELLRKQQVMTEAKEKMHRADLETLRARMQELENSRGGCVVM